MEFPNWTAYCCAIAHNFYRAIQKLFVNYCTYAMYERNDILSGIFLIHFLLLFFETEYENWFDHIHDQGVCYFHEGNVP